SFYSLSLHDALPIFAVLALVDAVPPPAARVMKFLSLLILMGFFVTMAWYGYIWSQFGANETSPAMTISKFWLYLSMPVGFAISADRKSTRLNSSHVK